MDNTRHYDVMRTRGIVVLSLGILAVIITSCGRTGDVATTRERLANRTSEPIVVAAAWPWSVRYDGFFWEGMKLALDEVNETGGILGRPLILQKEDDKESVNEGRRVAQRLSDDPNIVAVIGHLNSHVSIPASAIYDTAGLLMLTPGSTSPELTRRGRNLVFRSVNSDNDVAQEMIDFADRRGYRRIVICYVRNDYGLGLANALEEFALAGGLTIVDRQSYDPSASSNRAGYRRLVTQWLDMEFDAILLAGMAPQAGYLVKQMRANGLDIPILGGEALDTPEFIDAAGAAANGVIVASVFHPDDPREEVRRFNHRFESVYGELPDSWAARGYEAVRLLADAMEAAGSAAPRHVAGHLKSLGSRYSLSGPVTFSDGGDVIGKSMVRTIVRNGRFQYLAERSGPRSDESSGSSPAAGTSKTANL